MTCRLHGPSVEANPERRSSHARPSGSQRLRPHRPRHPQVRLRARGGRRVGRDQRPLRDTRDGPPAPARQRLRSLQPAGRDNRPRARRRRSRSGRLPGEGSGRAALARARGRRRDRVDRRLPHRRRGLRAPRSRRAQGDPLGAGEGRRADVRARRQLRQVRPRDRRRDLERLVHDELPGARRQGAARYARHPPRTDDHRSRLHSRPAPRRPAAQGPAAGSGCGAQPHPDHDRGREGHRPRHPGTGREAERLLGARSRADRARSSTSQSRSSGRRRSRKSTRPSPSVPTRASSRASSRTARSRSCPPTSSARRTRPSSTPA